LGIRAIDAERRPRWVAVAHARPAAGGFHIWARASIVLRMTISLRMQTTKGELGLLALGAQPWLPRR
jgi:hypothetical protein